MKHLATLVMATLIFLTALLPTFAAPTLQQGGGATHVVQRGETLYSIARSYGTTVDALRAANGLAGDTIWVGQVLVVGASSGSGQGTHTVMRGDTLYSIARRYGTTVDALMRANGLSNTNIVVGQQLRIGSTSAGGTTIYTVVRGDTLYAIARRYGTSVDALMARNGLSSAAIYVGQQLLIGVSTTPLPPVTALPTLTATSTAVGTSTPSPTGATATPTVTPTRTPTPTSSPSPTPSLTVVVTPIPSDVRIENIKYDGDVFRAESDEYATITNFGSVSQNLNGWRLYAGDPGQEFIFPNFELAPSRRCQVYTNEDHAESCGFSFRRGSAVWNNDGDCGSLYNSSNVLVSRFCYD